MKNWLKQFYNNLPPIKRIAALEATVEKLYTSLEEQAKDMDSFEKLFKKHTSIHVDTNSRDSTIVLTDRFQKADYVHIFSVDHGNFNYLVELVKGLAKRGIVKTLDTPYHLSASTLRVE